MFRTRVIYLWLQMIGACYCLLAALLVAAAVFAPDVKTMALSGLALFPLALGGCVAAIFGSFPMMTLLQRLLIAAGNRSGRPAGFWAFRRHLLRYSLVPAMLPVLLLLVPQVRQAGGPVLAVLLGAWAVATVGVWYQQARRLHAEWQAGRPY